MNLDPCHYFSAPGLSWDTMLKMTKVELEKISDADMHLFIEKGMWGGISYINNLYGGAMNEYLPHGGFKWVQVNNETVNRILNNSLDGYFL